MYYIFDTAIKFIETSFKAFPAEKIVVNLYLPTIVSGKFVQKLYRIEV